MHGLRQCPTRWNARSPRPRSGRVCLQEIPLKRLPTRRNQPPREDTRIVSFWPGLMRGVLEVVPGGDLLHRDLEELRDRVQRVARAHHVRHRARAGGCRTSSWRRASRASRCSSRRGGELQLLAGAQRVARLHACSCVASVFTSMPLRWATAQQRVAAAHDVHVLAAAVDRAALAIDTSGGEHDFRRQRECRRRARAGPFRRPAGRSAGR